jgi:AAA15 family ATPase/GTPase
MIKQIAIENFRCFGKTDIKDFQRVNLIGGLNNSGKTVLLEAILLICNPSSQTILFLKNLRSEDTNLEQQYPEYVWDNFFLNGNKKQPISISCINDNLLPIRPSISSEIAQKCDTQILKITSSVPSIINDTIYSDDIGQNIANLEGKLYFSYDEGNKVVYFFLNTKDKKIHASRQMTGFAYESAQPPTAIFIGVTTRKKPFVLAKEYSLIEKNGQANLILKALQLIDKSITAINISLMGETHISIEKSGKGFMPLSLFGDALNRIVQIILSIANNRGSVILIDEVENGIHHTAQREFWTYLFKIAKEFDVQVFATTHSLEMIKAFSEVAGKDFVEDAGYFELVRHLKTGEIVGIKHKLATLEYEIYKKLSFRGEPSV